MINSTSVRRTHTYRGHYSYICRVSGFARILNVPLEMPFATMRAPDKWQIVERGEMIEASSPDHAMHLLVGRPEQNKISESIGEVTALHPQYWSYSR